MVHQVVAHHLRGNPEEVRTILPVGRLLANQAQIGFVYECGALKSVIGALVPEMAAGQAAQFIVNDRYERFARFLISSTPICKQPADLAG